MSETKNTLGIVLLVVGLVIGAGGGYFFVQGNSNPMIAELTTEESTLLEEIQTSETTIASLTSDLDDLQSDVDSLDDLILDTQTQIDCSIDQMQVLEQSIVLETQKVNECTNQTTLLPNYERFGIYNLMFQYPKGMSVYLIETDDKPFSKENGGIIGDINIGAIDERLEFFWETLKFEADASVDLDTLVNEYVERLSESEFNYKMSIGDRITNEIDGHKAYRKTVYIDYRGEEIGRATFCVWYCDETELMYRSFYVIISYKSSINDRYGSIWQNTFCH